MRLKFELLGSAAIEEIPLSWSWDGAPPEAVTAEEAQMILLFEIAQSLKKLEFPDYQPD